jgi:hypothetical protein
MAVLNNSNAISSGGYDINNSLRFRASASAYLNRTPSSGGNLRTWTASFWYKNGAIDSNQTLFSNATSSDSIGFRSSRTIEIYFGAGSAQVVTTQVFRDTAAWYHIVVAVDTTQATAANRIKLYVNGSQVTAFSTATYPSQNYDTSFNKISTAQEIGRRASASDLFLDGYMAEVNWIDGQALTPSSFGETDTTTGVWKPKAYTGTYGTNGFYLKFSDIATTSGSNAGLGKDFSGNANYWTTNNISVTAGTTYDAMTDSPTLTSATVANYATWNGVAIGIDATLSSGNLNIAYGTASTRTGTAATMGMSSGKYYWEISTVTQSGTFEPLIGVVNTTLNSSTSSGIGIYPGYTANGWGYDAADGNKYTNGTGSAYGATWTSSDVIGVAFDADNGTLTFYKNNVSQGTAFTGLTSGPYFPAIGDGSTAGTFTMSANFGQRPFTYTPPTGYVALNTYNLPTPTILQGNKYMDATLYTGNSSTQTITNAGTFKPDLVWLKCRSTTGTWNNFIDSIRGTSKTLYSNTTNAEGTDNYLSAFNSNGFGLNVGDSGSNTSGNTYVGWQWQAGAGSSTSNTSGSITSTVSVNTTAGFSIVTYTGTGANATVGHGLGVAPKMIIIKNRSNAYNWGVYHQSLGATKYINLNKTDASGTSSTYWNNTEPDSSKFYVSTSGDVNLSTNNYVAYCWAEIAGFSKFGSYTGNGSTDGPFVYTGFRPKWIMVKEATGTNAASGGWQIFDTNRDKGNPCDFRLKASDSDAEGSGAPSFDIVSNGFKLRSTNSNWNDNNGTHIFMAFAENPFKNSLAR